MDWYKQSAVAGNSVAQANVGAAYGQGEGVDQDWAKSFYWYHRSAKQGFALGLHNLGVAFANGRGVSTDYAESYKWYILALEATPASDLIGRHLILRNIENVLKFLSPGEVDFANQIAKNWQPKNE